MYEYNLRYEVKQGSSAVALMDSIEYVKGDLSSLKYNFNVEIMDPAVWDESSNSYVMNLNDLDVEFFHYQIKIQNNYTVTARAIIQITDSEGHTLDGWDCELYNSSGEFVDDSSMEFVTNVSRKIEDIPAGGYAILSSENISKYDASLLTVRCTVLGVTKNIMLNVIGVPIPE